MIKSKFKEEVFKQTFLFLADSGISEAARLRKEKFPLLWG